MHHCILSSANGCKSSGAKYFVPTNCIMYMSCDIFQIQRRQQVRYALNHLVEFQYIVNSTHDIKCCRVRHTRVLLSRMGQMKRRWRRCGSPSDSARIRSRKFAVAALGLSPRDRGPREPHECSSDTSSREWPLSLPLSPITLGSLKAHIHCLYRSFVN